MEEAAEPRWLDRELLPSCWDEEQVAKAQRRWMNSDGALFKMREKKSRLCLGGNKKQVDMSSIKIEREERNVQGKSSGGSFWNERRNPRTVGNVPWWEMGGASNPLLLLLLLLLFLVLLLNCPKCLSEEPWNSPPFSTLILLCIYKIYSCQGPVRQSPKNPKRIPSTARRKSQIIDKKLFRRILTDSF